MSLSVIDKCMCIYYLTARFCRIIYRSLFTIWQNLAESICSNNFKFICISHILQYHIFFTIFNIIISLISISSFNLRFNIIRISSNRL